MTNTKSAEFRKKKSSNWQQIGGSAPTNAEQAAADLILAQAAEEAAQARNAEAEEDQPQMLESGAHAGLQSAEAVTAQLAARKRKEMADAAASAKEGSGETIYRDASGRIINVSMKRAEARREAEEAERKKQDAIEAMKGDVQQQEKLARQERLKDAKFMTFARGADDEEMNQELKERDRWGDPMAGYGGSRGSAGVGQKDKNRAGRKVYQGASEPNRYGIRPGHRWDGVDRGNGFEREWFKARNQKQNMRDLEYQWQMDE